MLLPQTFSSPFLSSPKIPAAEECPQETLSNPCPSPIQLTAVKLEPELTGSRQVDNVVRQASPSPQSLSSQDIESFRLPHMTLVYHVKAGRYICRMCMYVHGPHCCDSLTLMCLSGCESVSMRHMRWLSSRTLLLGTLLGNIAQRFILQGSAL